MAIVLVALDIVFTVLSYRKGEVPTLECPTTLEVPSSITDAELCRYVKAIDGDKDISDRVVVERKKYFLLESGKMEKGKSRVVFSVCDDDYNVASCTVIVHYTDYVSPRIYAKNSLIYQTEKTVQLPKQFAVEDCFDGNAAKTQKNINERLMVIADEYDYTTAGEYDITCKVTNSYGDTREIVFPVIITDDHYKASIELSQYVKYVTTKDRIADFKQYMVGVTALAVDEKIDTPLPQEYLSIAKVEIDDSEYQSDVPGVYSVFYKIRYNGALVARSRIIIVVEEA